jgi:hypothetical protein
MKKKILLQSAPFCFGPTSTLLNIAKHFGEHHDLLMIDEGPSGELLKLSGLNIRPVKIASNKPSKELEALLKSVDVIISNTDLEFARYCCENAVKKLVIVDTLFWMWDRIDPLLFKSSLYIIQDFFGTDEQLKRLGSPENLVRVGPLVNFNTNNNVNLHPQKILVSLGGCDCTLFDPEIDPLPALIIELIQMALKEMNLPAEKLIITVGTKTREALKTVIGDIEIKTLSNSDNQLLMNNVQAIFLSPGITGTFEAMHAGVPVFFLPPQNYSQLLQLNEYQKFGVAPFCFNWPDVYPSFTLPNYLPEKEAVSRTRNTVNQFLKDKETQEKFKLSIKIFIQSGINGYHHEKAKALLNKFGKDGIDRACQAIIDLIES